MGISCVTRGYLGARQHEPHPAARRDGAFLCFCQGGCTPENVPWSVRDRSATRRPAGGVLLELELARTSSEQRKVALEGVCSQQAQWPRCTEADRVAHQRAGSNAGFPLTSALGGSRPSRRWLKQVAFPQPRWETQIGFLAH